MPRLLKLDDGDRPIFPEDAWTLVEAADTAVADLPAGDLIVPLALWQRDADALRARSGAGSAVGVWLDAHEEAETLATDLQGVALVALNFPNFADGRNLSNAVLLRTRHGWQGELRAIGDVHRDLLAAMRRCGIDAFALNEDLDPEAAAAALRVMSDHYQGDVREPRPAFLRVERPTALPSL
ncbi:MAG TPA: DUF934 domain-containing protein [Pseudomonadales bacterium]|nr:DUF934 domain-containing protein [Pseudomonadales bacterium]